MIYDFGYDDSSALPVIGSRDILCSFSFLQFWISCTNIRVWVSCTIRDFGKLHAGIAFRDWSEDTCAFASNGMYFYTHTIPCMHGMAFYLGNRRGGYQSILSNEPADFPRLESRGEIDRSGGEGKVENLDDIMHTL